MKIQIPKPLLEELGEARRKYAEALCCTVAATGQRCAQIRKKAQAEQSDISHEDIARRVIQTLNAEADAAPPRAPGVSRIRYEREQPLRAFDKALDEIKRRGAEIGSMVFAGKLVRPYLMDRPGIWADVQSLELVPHTESTLATVLNTAVQFLRAKDNGADVPTDCPEKLVRALLGSARLIPEIEIRGVAETPVIVDNEVRTARGFDPVLRRWINSPEMNLPAVTDRKAAEAALERLESWIGEFSLVTPMDRSVALCGMLTAALRASVPHAPGFLVSKPSNGAGASTLCELWHIILTGRRAPVINATRDSEEMTKQIDGVQLAGRAAIVVDNVADGAEVRSIAIAQAITQPSREIRALGGSFMADTPCTQMVMVNGVNPRLAADLTRRFLYCLIDPCMENPEEKVYRRPNLLADAQRDRVSILNDCLMVSLAYLRSGEHTPGTMLDGFHDWQRMAQEPLIWLGLPDPVESRKKIVADDPVKSQLVSLFRAWHALYGKTPVTAATVIGQADTYVVDESGTAEEREARESARKELERVLDEIARDKAGKLSPKTFGYFLRGKKGRIAHGLRLEAHGETRDGAATYRIVPMHKTETQEVGKSDDGGDTSWLYK
jgi:putative DNA primase/helicase